MNKQIFLIHSRVGRALDLSFNLLSGIESCEITLIANERVIIEIERLGLSHYFSSIEEVSDEFGFDETKKVIISCLEKGNCDFEIVTLNESKVDLCGKLRVLFGLSEQDYSHFVYKDKMKQVVKDAGLLTPRFKLLDLKEFNSDEQLYVNEIIQEIGFPCFIKPLNLFASKNCEKISNRKQLVNWLTKKSLSPDMYMYEVEEFIDGTLYHCDSVIQKGQVVYSQVCEYSVPCFEIFNSSTLGGITLENHDPIAKEISSFCKKVNNAMLTEGSGVTHIEVFRSQGNTIFLEAAYRPNGISPTELYQKRAQLPLREMHLMIQMNNELELNIKEQFFAAWVLVTLPVAEGTLKKINLPNIKSKFEAKWNINIGDKLKSNQGYDDYAGVYILWHEDFETLQSDFKYMCEHQHLQMH